MFHRGTNRDLIADLPRQEFKNQAGGYTMVALNSVAKLERKESGAWVDVPVKPLLAKEKKDCREAAND
ncbi:MAG TPA: hypothetical protein VGL25_01355 [Casimicrobiaceae bacterium]